MALDGLFLYKLAEQLSAELVGTRVEKIYQPSKEELVFVMRSRQGAKKLYFNCRADGARVHLTESSFINPANPPMLCMLLRKKFTSAWLERIEQPHLDRILIFHFSALNDFGERVPLQLICEIMGRYSNIIITDEGGKIVDSVKRVGASKSSVREILPGMEYVLPPAQDKYHLLEESIERICTLVFGQKNLMLSKAILNTVRSISPLRCRELCHEAYGDDIPVYEAEKNEQALIDALYGLKQTLEQPALGCMIEDGQKPIAFSFTDICQFGDFKKSRFESLSALLDKYYENRLITVKRTQSGGELLKLIKSNMDKLSRKIALQQKELRDSEDSEKYKLYGELIQANAFSLPKNTSAYEVLNYYNGETVSIPADLRLSPSENANKYYKEYRKKQNAKVYITEQLAKGEEQLAYLESCLDILERAETPAEIAELKRELVQQGYLKAKVAKREKAAKPLKPLLFKTSGGYTVMVGRNNLSNDTLTFKTARGNDIWLHTKNIHGSHTVLITNGAPTGEKDLVEAAEICAYYSKGRDSSNVPVDFTRIKFVKRQPSKIPGRVFYTDYQTIYVTPDKEKVEKLKQ